MSEVNIMLNVVTFEYNTRLIEIVHRGRCGRAFLNPKIRRGQRILDVCLCIASENLS